MPSLQPCIEGYFYVTGYRCPMAPVALHTSIFLLGPPGFKMFQNPFEPFFNESR